MTECFESLIVPILPTGAAPSIMRTVFEPWSRFETLPTQCGRSRDAPKIGATCGLGEPRQNETTPLLRENNRGGAVLASRPCCSPKRTILARSPECKYSWMRPGVGLEATVFFFRRPLTPLEGILNQTPYKMREGTRIFTG